MSWNKITGQHRIKEILSKAIDEGKIAHAYILTGDEGVGKDALALEFAKVLNCSSPRRVDGIIEACGECADCAQAEKLQHPNINMIFALPTGKSNSGKELNNEQIAEVREQIELKAADNYYKLAVPKASSVRISTIRDIKKKLSLSNSFRGRHCVLLFDADMMTTESANAFLKTLEEPHDNVTLILTTSKPDAILQTIMSRCRHIECPSLADQEVADAVVEKYNLSEADAKIAAAFAQGSLTRAALFMSDDIRKLRENLIGLLRTTLKKGKYRIELEAGIEEIFNLRDRNDTELVLKLILLWMRDVLSYIKTADPENIINIDQIEIIKSFATNFSHADLFEAVRITEDSIGKIRRNVQAKLVIVTLFLSLRKIFLTNKQ
ncbi:MAG: DNA polymerase III subunit [Chlorobi bacterium]|nr:DNA polymerase III subunit [Chlorobiota bacterium]